jgi:hypothetical protein
LAVILFMNNFIELNEIHKRFPGQWINAKRYKRP